MTFEQLIDLFEQTQTELQQQAARSVDIALVVRNWLFGWYIVEYEQRGEDRAEYGSRLIEVLSKRLTQVQVRGSSATRLKLYRLFYTRYHHIGPTASDESGGPILDRLLPIGPTASDESRHRAVLPQPAASQRAVLAELAAKFHLGWSHYVTLMTIDDADERRFYEIEAAQSNWGVRELRRQISSSLYERLALSRDKAKVRELSDKGQVVGVPADIIKNPYVLEFLQMEEQSSYSEHDLEAALIDKIEHFLLELGKGFLFEARQKRFSFDDDHFYVDLVFYNRLLRCYVLIDLKRGKLTHQDLGQMQMYVNYFDRFVKLAEEAPTVGILLCHRKSDALVELTLPEDAQIFASKYELYLPSKEELRRKLVEWTRDE